MTSSTCGKCLSIRDFTCQQVRRVLISRETKVMHEFHIGPIGDWNGSAKVVVKTGNIFEEIVDVVCVSVSGSLDHSSSVWTSVTKAAGLKEYKEAYVKAKKELTHWLSRGEVLAVDTTKTKLSSKFVFLVVHPDIHHLDEAYRNVLYEAVARECTSIAIPGLGCGNIGNSVHGSCLVGTTTLYDVAAANALGSLKVVEFVDVNEKIAEQFVAQLHVKLGLTSAEVKERTADHGIWKYAKHVEKVLEDDCVICLSALPRTTDVCELACGHQYHVECFNDYVQSANAKKCCAICGKYFEIPLGNQPVEARMEIRKNYGLKLPGNEDTLFTYEIHYTVPSGIQSESHLRPGKPFKGTRRTAFLPGGSEGTQVGDSMTTGAKNVVVWNNVHHKTNISGGPTKYGYPDPDYLNRVREDLSAMGITEEMIPSELEI